MNSASTFSTPPLSVPPTQNTAPVVRFQCLFTHDVRRKAKRWQDGYLRFHTFNRRIMVYDIAGHLIGDLHWRESDRIHDGDELELERGVLVQVGEELESTVTDLTPLLEKKRPSSTSDQSPPARVPLSQNRPSATPTPYPSSNRLKSLNEVLGIQKTLPANKPPAAVRSPFEERQQQQVRAGGRNNGPAERPSKKRKKSPEYDDTELRAVKDERPTRRNDVADDIYPDDNDARSVVAAGALTSTKLSKAYQTPLAPSANPSFQLASNLKPEDLRSSSKGGWKKKDSRIPSNQKSVTDMLSSKPVTTLSVATEKPRKKLMCLEMLSGPSSDKQPVGMKHPILTARYTHQPTNADNFNPTGEPSRKASKRTIASRPNDKGGNVEPFLGVEAGAPPEPIAVPSSQKNKSLLAFFKPKTAIKPNSRPDKPEQEEDIGIVNDSMPIDDSNSKLPPPDRQPIQRSFSTTDVPLEQPLSISIDLKESQLTPNAQSHPNPPPSSKLQVHGKGGLQKSLSDTSTLRGIQKPNHRTIQTKLFATAKEPAKSNALGREEEMDVDEEANEKGPWTVEALDLFDWWPPDRPRPGAVGIPC